MLSDRQAVEVFHLRFLHLLFAGRDRKHYVVKGGGNLRFFFGSTRYSEDLDLDVREGSPHAVKDRVDSIFESRTLREALDVSGLDVRRVTAPKQTPTTQRWKVEVFSRDLDIALNTKLEFSHRENEGEFALDPVEPRLCERYRLMPIVGNHYVLPTAIRQKVGALVGRREVQARDVFDLSLLFARAAGNLAGYDDLRERTPAAIERVWAVSYDDYRGQVCAFLEPESAEAHGSEAAWEALQFQVVTALERIGGRS